MQVFIGGSRDQRAAAVRAYAESVAGPNRLRQGYGGPPKLHAEAAGPVLLEEKSAAGWPFLRHVVPVLPDGPSAILWFRDLHLAFPPPTVPGLRCVLTQSTYQLQRVLDAVAANPSSSVIADGDNRLRSEMSGQRGPWSRITVSDLGSGGHEGPDYERPEHVANMPNCTASLLLHRATRELETRDVEAARATLTEAVSLAPDWEAAHFEYGKLCLITEDTEGAAAAFAEAGRLMPSFAAAFSNLGAALGELGRSGEALAALEHALAHDPHGFPILNNIGAVHREAGRLDQAEAAFRGVQELAPQFAFGHYNLGHTLLLAGRFSEARDAYEEGYDRDPQRNVRQAARLVVARAATGHEAGALQLLETIGQSVPPDLMRELATEMEHTLEGGLTASVYPETAASACRATLAALRRFTAP